jgi:hypothetical protein
MWSLVPQVFYDFVARIVPGASLILVTILVFSPTNILDLINSQSSDKLLSAGFLVIWALASYLIGFLTGQLWELTFGQITRRLDKKVETKCQGEILSEHNRILGTLKQPLLAIASKDLPKAYIMRDQIRYVSPEEGSRLLKVQAERRACQTLFLGVLILSLIHAGTLIARFEISGLVIEIILVAVAAIFWIGAQRLHRLLVNGTTLSWLALVSAHKLPL